MDEKLIRNALPPQFREELEVAALDRQVAEEWRAKRIRWAEKCLSNNNGDRMLRVPELKEYFDRVEAAAAGDPNANPTHVAFNAVDEEWARIYREYKKAGGDTAKMKGKDRVIAETIAGKREIEYTDDNGKLQKGPLKWWDGKNLFELTDKQVAEAEAFHTRMEKIRQGQMKILQPLAEQLLGSAYEPQRGYHKMLDKNDSPAVQRYKACQETIRLYDKIYSSCTWDEMRQPFGNFGKGGEDLPAHEREAFRAIKGIGDSWVMPMLERIDRGMEQEGARLDQPEKAVMLAGAPASPAVPRKPSSILLA